MAWAWPGGSCLSIYQCCLSDPCHLRQASTVGRQGDPSRSSKPRSGDRRCTPLFSKLQPVVDSCLLSWFLEAPPGRKELVSAEASSFLILDVEDVTIRTITGNIKGQTIQKGSLPFPTHTKAGFVFESTPELCDNPGIIRSHSQV